MMPQGQTVCPTCMCLWANNLSHYCLNGVWDGKYLYCRLDLCIEGYVKLHNMACMHTHICAHIHTHKHTCTHTDTQTTHTDTQTTHHTDRHICKHTHTRITCAHTHTYIHSLIIIATSACSNGRWYNWNDAGFLIKLLSLLWGLMGITHQRGSRFGRPALLWPHQ